MLVSAEIRTVSTGGIKHKEGLEQHKQSAGGQDGLLYGRLKVAGLHPKLVEVIPSPEDFKSSSHYPLLISNSPFLQQVRGRGRQSKCSLDAAAACLQPQQRDARIVSSFLVVHDCYL